MKNKGWFLPICGFIAAAIMVTAVTITVNREQESPVGSQASVTMQETSRENSTGAPLYEMKIYEEIIGVYHYGEAIPFQLVDVAVDSLPPGDVSLLKTGIRIYSDEELRSLIEDFDG